MDENKQNIWNNQREVSYKKAVKTIRPWKIVTVMKNSFNYQHFEKLKKMLKIGQLPTWKFQNSSASVGKPPDTIRYGSSTLSEN